VALVRQSTRLAAQTAVTDTAGTEGTVVMEDMAAVDTVVEATAAVVIDLADRREL
jgi:hypothetical protein